MRTTPILSVALVLAPLSVAPAAQAPVDQLAPGPENVSVWDWSFGNVATTDPINGGPLVVNHYGRTMYPSTAPGGVLTPAAAGAFPLVVFGHGRFHTGPTLGSNHEQADYLLERLASWGFVAVSVNLDVVGQFGNPAAIPQRGDIFLETVRDWLDLANVAPGAPPGLAAAIDGTRIALAGHSRGGEGAVAAVVKNQQAPAPFPILAIGTIAPTDFEQYQVPSTIAYMGIYGSKDGDVNNGWPIALHDRARSTECVFEYVYGANHFFFTETITYSLEGNADIPRSLHHDIAMGYIGGFLGRKLAPSPAPAPEFADGPELSALTSQAEILPLYRAPERLVLDSFESQPALSVTSASMPAAAAFPVALETSFQQQNNTLYHLTRGLVAVWVGDADGLWATLLDANGFDATGWTHMSGRFAQRFNSPANTPNVPLDLSFGLLDEDGDLALVSLSAYGTIPWPASHPGTFPFPPFPPKFPTKTVLRTTRVPLTAFVAANPALDLDRLLFAGFLTDVGVQGEVEVDELEFVK